MICDVSHQLDVFFDGEARHQVIKLKHKADVLAPVASELFVTGAVQFMISKMCAAGRGPVQPAENVQQGGFAAARRAQQHDELAGINIEIDVLQRTHLGITSDIALAECACLEDCTMIG